MHFFHACFHYVIPVASKQELAHYRLTEFIWRGWSELECIAGLICGLIQRVQRFYKPFFFDDITDNLTVTSTGLHVFQFACVIIVLFSDLSYKR